MQKKFQRYIMSNNFINIPFQIEGLVLTHDKMVMSPLADFTKLPWNNGNEDINFDQPFIGDGIIRQPFGSQDFLLKKGLHLHFIIPHYLGQAVPEGVNNLPNTDKLPTGKLPAAPNRWMVIKTKHSDSSLAGQWIIESDYIHTVNYDPNTFGTSDEPTCIIPYNDLKPFRYMGRKVDINSYSNSGNAQGTYLKVENGGNALTVVGYGDINFSSYYPNCLGVFGFWDADETQGLTDANDYYEYTVLGWHDSETDDLLYNYLSSIITGETNNNSDFIATQLKNLFKLDFDIGPDSLTAPPRSIFCGKIAIDANAKGPETINPSNLTVGIGNTGTEAISAFVANNLSNAADLDDKDKSKIEDQLEAMMLNSKLNHLLVDIGPKFLEARHDKGFKSSPSGHLWRIVSTTPQPIINNGIEQAQGYPEMPVLDPTLAKLLHLLNVAQNNYDKTLRKIISLQQQLFLDWAKYMRATYPPIEGRGQYPDADHIRYFLENYSFIELENLNNLTGQLIFGDASKSFKPTATSNILTSLDSIVAQAWQKVIEVLTDTNNTANITAPQLSLAMIAGPRYWEATAPAVLISGLDAGDDEQMFANKNINIINSSFQFPIANYSNLALGDILTQLNCSSSLLSSQIWKPFLLDWEIDFLKQSSFTNYGSDSIKNNFNLNEFGPDLIPNVKLSNSLSVFSGSVIMSPLGRKALLASIKLFIQSELKNIGVVFSDANTIDKFLPPTVNNWADFVVKLPASQTSTSTTVQVTSVSSATYKENSLYTAWMAYQNVLDKNIITQTLDGFNHACIMQRKTPQLPIAEPIGFDDAKKFTSKVKQLVANVIRTSPITAFDFNPLRCGELTINKLRLIDNFGIKLDIDNIEPVIADTLCENNSVFLKPRIGQPARLNFRWISAAGEIEPDADFEDEINYIETNDHPDTTPVCGWLLPNYFDNTLAVYSSDGYAIGYINNNLNWNVPAWVNLRADITHNVSNQYLLNVLLWIINDLQLKNRKLNDFLDRMKTALNNTAPSATSLYSSKSLLMGRPIAVTRARLSFQVRGLPTIAQDWSSLLVDLNNCDQAAQYTYKDRDNRQWTSVKLPLRLGEHWQLNDGLLGYWLEDGAGSLSNTLISPELVQEKTDTDIGISSFGVGVFQTQWLTLSDKPINVTMLCDPNGVMHATTGILPTKAISIPPQHYLPALKNINMWFYSPSLLQPDLKNGNKLFLNLPKVEDNVWQYWNADNGVMEIMKDDAKTNLHCKFKLMDGWLNLGPESQGLKIEIKEANSESVLQSSLSFYANISGFPQAAQTYLTSKAGDIAQEAATLKTNINACMAVMQTVNTQVNNLDDYVVQGDNDFSLASWLINITTTSPVNDWNKFYGVAGNANNNINNHFGYSITGCDFSCITQFGSGIQSTFNPSNPWSNVAFMNYVNTNFQNLCNQFNTYVPSGGYLFLADTTGGPYYIVPCQALYDFFWLMYQSKTNSSISFLMSIETFSVDAWQTAVNKASTMSIFNQAIYQSAQGVNSTYNIDNPFTDNNFIAYLNSNFNTLCNQIPAASLISYNGSNYIIPCQSLYDYFYASYQITKTSNN